MADFVRTETSDAVALIRIERPERRNALNLQLKQELVEAMETAIADDQ